MIAISLALVAAAVIPLPQETTALTLQNLDATLAHILPAETEVRWKDVDWRVALGDGVLEARAAEKPILLWAMNGHPLGCV